MPLYKKGTCYSSVLVSSSVYACTNCDYTEIAREGEKKERECPKCHSKMRVISSQTEAIESEKDT